MYPPYEFIGPVGLPVAREMLTFVLEFVKKFYEISSANNFCEISSAAVVEVWPLEGQPGQKKL